MSFSQYRWPYYLYTKGYHDNAMFSYGGMRTETALADFKWAVNELGYTPRFAVWGMGMNNEDSPTAANTTWLNCTEEFLDICEEKGITPILMTIPSTTTRLNEYKNAWIRNWSEETGGRYIDAAKAVGGDKYDASRLGQNQAGSSTVVNDTGYDWYEGLLGTDGVHPTVDGARVLYSQVIIDFPEIADND